MEKNTKKEIRSWIKSIILALVIALLCREFLFSPVRVEGKSMMPTYQHNNRLIISKTSNIDYFDIIVFNSPVANSDYIKRVIGLPGDKIEMKNDTLFINGVKYEEPYLDTLKQENHMLTKDFSATVPEDSYFVLGDNRNHSLDSRDLGAIDSEAVVGEVKLRFFPFNKFGTSN
ncbi:signal peptidase I [Bacillus spongiae]|uniref:Signal peptidase I n=1 Tax=Bacillus spongiae TaxID=2683610 RepID=A0ABU8HAX8_9BACI